MASRNVDKGREAENAVAKVLQGLGFPHAERRSKRGGRLLLSCDACTESAIGPAESCSTCRGKRLLDVPADAGDLTGIPGVVIQVKWSPYMPLTEAMRRTEEQRRAGRAQIGLLVVKRKAVGLARAGEWDAYLPQWAVRWLLTGDAYQQTEPTDTTDRAVWHTDLTTAARLIAHAGYGTPTGDHAHA